MEYRRSVSDNLFDGCPVVKVVLATKKKRTFVAANSLYRRTSDYWNLWKNLKKQRESGGFLPCC